MAVNSPSGLHKDDRSIRKEIAAVTVLWPFTLAFFIGKGIIWVFGGCIDLIGDIIREVLKNRAAKK
jgi:hypothetical protein